MARLTDRPTSRGRTPEPAVVLLDDESTALTPLPPLVYDGEVRHHRALPRTFEAFADREFRWFYLSMLGQMAAMNMQLIVRPYLAFELTGSYAALGLVSLMSALPMLFLAVFGGVIADRVPKRTVLQWAQALSMLNALGLAALAFTGVISMEWLYVSALAQGTVMALTMPARQAMIPEIIGTDRLMNAVALNTAGMNTMRMSSPAAGGFIIAFAGFGWAFTSMAVLFALAFFAMAKVTPQAAVVASERGRGARQAGLTALRDIWDGLRYIRGNGLIFALLSMFFVSSIFGMPYQFLLSGYVVDVMGGDSGDVGVLMSASAVGALAGALVLASLPERHRGWLFIGGTTILAIGLITFAQTDQYWLAGLFIMIVGVGSAFRQALSQGLLHATVEDAYRGRVMAVFMTQISVMQFATFLAGVIAEFVGIQATFAGLGVCLLITTALYAAFVPVIRRVN